MCAWRGLIPALLSHQAREGKHPWRWMLPPKCAGRPTGGARRHVPFTCPSTLHARVELTKKEESRARTQYSWDLAAGGNYGKPKQEGRVRVAYKSKAHARTWKFMGGRDYCGGYSLAYRYTPPPWKGDIPGRSTRKRMLNIGPYRFQWTEKGQTGHKPL